MRTEIPAELELSIPTPSTDSSQLHVTIGSIDQLVEIVKSRLEINRSLLTKKEVATYLNVSIRTIDTLISEGELIPIKIRTSNRFTPESIERYIHSRA